jgi:hypothetical protein
MLGEPNPLLLEVTFRRMVLRIFDSPWEPFRFPPGGLLQKRGEEPCHRQETRSGIFRALRWE